MLKKKYLKSRPACKVTFSLPVQAAEGAGEIRLVGDFNNWSLHGHRMKKLKNGDYGITLNLKPGREYQFRYLLDNNNWKNDDNADKFVPSPFGDSKNSVIAT